MRCGLCQVQKVLCIIISRNVKKAMMTRWISIFVVAMEIESVSNINQKKKKMLSASKMLFHFETFENVKNPDKNYWAKCKIIPQTIILVAAWIYVKAI